MILLPNSKTIDPVRIGARIRGWRRAQGLKQRDVADRSGVLRENVSRLERGFGMPSLLTIERVCTAIGMPVALVFQGDGP